MEAKMETDWMGRYRPLVAALVLHANVVNRGLSMCSDIGDGIMLNPQEWQVLEFVIEHSDSYFSMIEISRELGIPQSSFSRIVKTIQDYKLISKYQVAGNRKNIVLRPTEYGKSLYSKRVGSSSSIGFNSFFEELDSLSDDCIKTFTRALNHLTLGLPSARDSQEVELIEIE